MEIHKKPSVMVAEDDPDDRFLIKHAFESLTSNPDIKFVNDGVELLGYLDNACKNSSHSLPDLIILDLNMPKMSGQEALREIKRKKALNSIDIVVLSTSRETADIEFLESQGVRSFYSKPDSFQSLVEIIETIMLK